MSITQEMLIAALSDGRFHSGTELGKKWGITRAAVSMLVRRCCLPGIEIYRVRGKGYRLKESLELLNREAILQQLPKPRQELVADMHVCWTIPSTSSFLLQCVDRNPQLNDDCYRVCLSEMQTAGRGSRGRRWVSPFGHNIYLSILRAFDVAPPELGGLSIVAGLALLRTLKKHGVRGAGFKWPNDIHIDSRKVAGILVEVRSQVWGPTHVVIGVGVNLQVRDDSMKDVDQPWGAIAGWGFDLSRRNVFAGDLLNELIELVEAFRHRGLRPYLDELSAYDLVKGRDVQFLHGSKKVVGKGGGIDHLGRLVIQTDDGLQLFSSGEVSLRSEGIVGMVRDDSRN